MGGWIWALIPAVLTGGGWARDVIRRGQQDRHQRKMAVIEATEKRQAALEARDRPADPVCGCEHHLAKHDREGRCHEVVQAPTGWDADRNPTGYAPAPCTCQRYVGPEPLGTVYAPPLSELG
ncbi:hypothetical protein [Kitasatospora sp. McL0602]|uniref:hypothetical protein n=1 Tax=Kitasatospora sp. McL0602 TaxID=3439530 RepID=UPI003F8980EB